MTPRTIIPLLFTITSTEILLAQVPLSAGLCEAQGSVFYSFSNHTRPPEYRETFERYSHQHNISLQPSVGYFLSEDWEVVLQPRYSYQLLTYNSGEYRSIGSGYEVIERKVQRWSHSLGILMGVSFHIPVSQSVSSFFGLSGGLNWRKVTEEFEGGYYPNRPWSKPEVMFPNVAAGIKIFLIQDWAIIPQAQLMYTSYPEASYYEKETVFSFGVGFAVYFNHNNGS